MSDNVIRLLDASGRVITEFHPDFKDRMMEFGIGYNDVPERRGRAKPLMQSGAETWYRNRDRLKSTADARDAAEFDWIGGVIDRVVLYVVGKLRCDSQTNDPEINLLYDEYFHGWCGDDRLDDGTTRCDLSGRHRFLKQLQMAFRAFIIDGDYGFIEIDPRESPTGEFCLQGIESDRIGSPLESVQDENYIGGITIEPTTGRIISIRVFDRTRTGQYTNPREVPIDSFIHVFDTDRSDEYRGRTKLLRILNDLRDIREWIEAEKIAGKTQAQWAALIGTKDPFNGTGPMAWTNKNQKGTPTQDAEWGKLLKLAEGESFSMLSPSSRPSGAFMAFVQMLIRKMAAALSLSYGFLWDLSMLGGANVRIELESDLRRIQFWQENILINRILNRVRNKVIAQGIAQGVIPPHPMWKKCDWHFGPWITADVGYAMDADIAAINMGIVPVKEVMAKYDRSAKEVFDSNARTANEAIEAGTNAQIPAEVFARGLYPDITRQKAAFLTPTPLPPPVPGSLEAIGDKGVMAMMKLMEDVGEGKIDRESAINTAMRVFKLTRGQAEKMIPDEPSEEDKNRAAGLDPQGRHAPVVSSPGGQKAKQSSSKPRK